jgi:hypothetical protein
MNTNSTEDNVHIIPKKKTETLQCDRLITSPLALTLKEVFKTLSFHPGATSPLHPLRRPLPSSPSSAALVPLF